MFMPELAEARIQGKASWGLWYSTPSIRATGKTKQGNAVVVYAHIPNYFSNPANIMEAIKPGLFKEAGMIPEKEFWKLVDAEDGKKVFVDDYKKVKNSPSRGISLDSALEHPQIIPFLGGREIAEKYLAKYKEIYKTDKIGVRCSDSLIDSPVGRLLSLGYDSDTALGALGSLGGFGYFLGACNKKPENVSDQTKVKKGE
jgi:hypothetical protein